MAGPVACVTSHRLLMPIAANLAFLFSPCASLLTSPCVMPVFTVDHQMAWSEAAISRFDRSMLPVLRWHLHTTLLPRAGRLMDFYPVAGSLHSIFFEIHNCPLSKLAPASAYVSVSALHTYRLGIFVSASSLFW